MNLFDNKQLDGIVTGVMSHNSKPIGVFITDLHLEEGNTELVKSVFRKSIQITKSLGFTVIYCGGDIFDSRKAQSLLIQNTFKEILEMFREERIRLVVAPGNHDKTDYTSPNSFIDSFAFSPMYLDNYNPFFLVADKHHTEELTSEISITLTPFFEDPEYLQNINDIPLHLFEQKYKKKVHLTHIGFEGSVMNSGIKVSGSVGKSVADLFDLTLVGHYHDYQELYDGSVVYFGSAYQRDYGENNKKGITILYEDLSLKQIGLGTPEFIKYEVEVKDFSEKEILDLKKEKEKSGNHLRVVLKGNEEDVNSFNKQLLLNEGIEVERKTNKIVKEVVEQEVERFESNNILTSFRVFLEKKEMEEDEIVVGESYLIKGLNSKKQS